MTFGSTFGRTFSPTFQPKSQAAKAGYTTWWDLDGTITSCIAAYQPKGAASYAASKINLANPGTYDATEGIAPDFNTATGWSFNGSNNYLKTGVVPASGYSMIIRFAGGSTNAVIRSPARSQSGVDLNTRFGFYSSLNTGKRGYAYGNNNTTTGASIAEGVMAVTSAGNYYLDGSLDASVSSPTWTGTGVGIYIGAANGGNVATYHFDGDVYALAIYSVDISSYIVGLTTAMAAL